MTYFLAFLVTGFLPAWVFLLVLYRDVTVSFVRLLAMRKSIVMSARPSGKIKAVIYAVGLRCRARPGDRPVPSRPCS
ncbi:MAG: hypothetical protein MZV70_69605 [Desulfobacterales bacterium]|nr:hypothetical protein [Desulfobacterales bacterium]